MTGWARLRGIDVEPRVESQDPALLHTLLASDANRADLVDRISALVAENGYDGINIDFEAGAAADRPLLTAFASQLAQTLHAQGAKLTMAVAAKTSATLTGRAGFYDYPALAGIADRLFVMAWDLHWSTSLAGPISDATWVGKIIKYVTSVPNAQRFTIGTQLYGFDWPLGAKATPYEWDDMTALQSTLGAQTLWDAVAQEPYFTYADASGSRTRPTTRTLAACRDDSARRAPPGSASASGASATKTRRHGTFPRSSRDAYRQASWPGCAGEACSAPISCCSRPSSGSSRARICPRSGSIRCSGSTACA